MKDALLRFKLVTYNLYTFCNNSVETIIHIFCYCIHTTEIWSKLEYWLSRDKYLLSLEIKISCLGFTVIITVPSTVL